MSDKKIVDITQLNSKLEDAKAEETKELSDLVNQEQELIERAAKKEDPEEAAGDTAEELSLGESIQLDDVGKLPRVNGKIDVLYITLGKSKRNNHIVRNDIFDRYYNELPDKVENQAGSWRTVSTGGKIRILGGDPENDKNIHIEGGKALQATIKQQRTFAEAINTMLAQPASKETCEELGLKPGTDNLDAIIAAAARQATRGNVRAMDFVRDTIGQKPSENINAAITGLTEEDKQMLQNIQSRLNNK